MSEVLRGAAVVCTVLGLTCAAGVLVRTRDPRLGLAVLLDFLLAAGLLRLGGDPQWRALVTAALVVAVRKLVMTVGLRPRPLA
jgi:hypothetical protein